MTYEWFLIQFYIQEFHVLIKEKTVADHFEEYDFPSQESRRYSTLTQNVIYV